MGTRAVFVYAPGDGNRTRQGAELRKCVSIFQRSTQGPKARSETRICEANPWTSRRPLHKNCFNGFGFLWGPEPFSYTCRDPTSPPKLRLNTDCLLAFANPLKSGVANLERVFDCSSDRLANVAKKALPQNDWSGVEPRKRPIYYVWPAGVDHSSSFGKSASRLPAVLIFRISVWSRVIG